MKGNKIPEFVSIEEYEADKIFSDNSNFSKEENEWMKKHNMNPNDYVEADYL